MRALPPITNSSLPGIATSVSVLLHLEHSVAETSSYCLQPWFIRCPRARAKARPSAIERLRALLLSSCSSTITTNTPYAHNLNKADPQRTTREVHPPRSPHSTL